MADEFDLNTLDSEIENNNRVEKRIKDLSEKVKLTAEERDEHKRLLDEQMQKTAQLEKERDFLNSFGDQLTKFPEASSFKNEIKERVLKGYSVEDATAAVLVAQGKYAPPRKEEPVENYAGGSATTVHQAATGEKAFHELSREEKRARLLEAEQRGDLGVN